MSTGTASKRLKKKFKKKLYQTLVKLNEVDFSRYRFLCYLLLITSMLLALAKLPTSKNNNADSASLACSAELAASVRTALLDQQSSTAEVIALFLPDASGDKTGYSETLYSFYLTGTELSYLAEGSAAIDLGDSTLYLDGLEFTYHKNRLPFDRITALSTSDGKEPSANVLYRVISTEDIFALFHYISYRSIGIMNISPKDGNGQPLSDYQKVLLTESGEPMTLGIATALAETASVVVETVPSVTTVRGGFNLLELVREPNKITICVATLFIALIALLWYTIPRIRRVRIWFRIYRIRSKKRSTHTFFYRQRKRY